MRSDQVRRDIEQIRVFMRDNRRASGRIGLSTEAMIEVRRNPAACGVIYDSGRYYAGQYEIYENGRPAAMSESRDEP